MKILLHSLLCALAILAAPVAAAEDSLKELFAKVAATYGGTPPSAMIEQGTTVSKRRGDGTLLRMYKAPDRFRIQIDYPTGSEARTMAGADAWQQGAPANPVLRAAIALQTARIALPWNMLAKQSAAVDLGKVSTPDGKSARAVEFPLEEGLKLVVEIDPASGRMLRSRGIQSLGGGSMEFATVYSDFRTMSGRLHAAREEHYAMGQHTGHSVIDKVSYPDTIPDKEFMP